LKKEEKRRKKGTGNFAELSSPFYRLPDDRHPCDLPLTA